MHRNRAILPAAVFTACALLAGCSTVKSLWPFGQEEALPAPAVNELEVTVPGDSAPQVVLQYWERNTLVVDLQNASASGQVVLTRREGQAWPARLGFRMSPTRFESLEVRGTQRVVLPVSAGTAPVTVELPPGVYDGETAGIAVKWGAGASF